MKHLVFVYGTLKRGEYNHGLMQGQRYVGQAVTQPRYRLYALDTYPALVDAPSDGCPVEGELWEVDAAAMPALDRLEGTAEGLYKRVTLAMQPPHDHEPIEGYLYLRSISGRRDCGTVWTG